MAELSITIIQIGKLMQVTSSIKTLNSSTTKKCKCSSEIQTRAANPHTPSSDKNLRVNIKDLCDRVKIKQDTRPNAQKWNVGLEHRKGLGTSRADVSGNARHFCEDEFNYQDVSKALTPQTHFNLQAQKYARWITI